MDSLELHELNPKSAGIGAWVLKVHKLRLIEYEYTWQNKPRKSQKLECLLVAASGIYCQGVIKAVNRGRRCRPCCRAETNATEIPGRDGVEHDESHVS